MPVGCVSTWKRSPLRLDPERSDVRFAAEASSVVAIMGPSGSGKTTFLHVLGGLLAPDSGTAILNLRASEQIAWIVQNSPLLPRRTSQENVALGALAIGQDWDKAQYTAALLLQELGLAHTSSTAGYRLSGGEKQRVAVGRAMAARSSLILADEPTASLDAGSRSLVCEALRKSAAQGSSVVVSTHECPHRPS